VLVEVMVIADWMFFFFSLSFMGNDLSKALEDFKPP